MIQKLSGEYKQLITWSLFIIFYLQFSSPLLAMINSVGHESNSSSLPIFPRNLKMSSRFFLKPGNSGMQTIPSKLLHNKEQFHLQQSNPGTMNHLQIGGPTSPEASSFKAVGANNLVNLFTGDFSYSIPLLDVGGYPVNIFYNAGIGMEQEASWVGLGWNLNPGTVNRNMRGIPDDFDGTDLLTVEQNVRPNRTYGGELGLDVELLGSKTPAINVGINTGLSYNNYLGPEITMGTKLSLAFSLMNNAGSEKAVPASPAITAVLGAKLSSRSGLTFSPSLSASLPLMTNGINQGIGLSTSYNSRTGIKELNISGQVARSAAGGISLTPGLHMGTSISFAKPAYLPTLRMPMVQVNTTAQMEFGAGAYGIRGSLSGMGYYSESIVPEQARSVTKPLVGFIYSEKGNENAHAVMDFNRLGDAEVTPNTPIISAPHYNYDIFSIQGEGTGGTIRAYRGDLGFMRDNLTGSSDESLSVGIDLAPPMHYGGNFNTVSTPTRVGGWNDHTNTLHQTMRFKPRIANSSFENIYFRNPGETTVTNPALIGRIGNDNLVRFQLGGPSSNTTLLSALELFDKRTGTYKGSQPVMPVQTAFPGREKRTQVSTILSAGDAARIGLDTAIKSYSGTFDTTGQIQFDLISRDSGFRKSHHISEVNVLEQSGMRYVYGIPVYSLVQKDYTFTVGAMPDSSNIVGFNADEPTINSRHLQIKSAMHGYFQSQEVPAFASSFLITGLLSPDFVDVTGNGITEDDLGTAVKFDYTRSAGLHRWRTPRNNALAGTAFFNEGTRTEKKDNKATISYGEREVWYLRAIESKSLVAVFKTEARDDGKGVTGPLDGRINGLENVNKKLSRIDLYTKASIKAHGITKARPLKSVFFIYDYSLCTGTPDNTTGGGKLTLKEIYFSYNGQVKSKDRYVFAYDAGIPQNNPAYSVNASDKWGTYKNRANNPAGLSNTDHPYTPQDKSLADQFAAAWSLKKILLPSGGQMEVQYEADDYAYTQNRRACDMFAIAGLGTTKAFQPGNNLYEGLSTDNFYVYVQIPDPLENSDPLRQREEIFSKFLEGINQLAFKLVIKMPNGNEPLTCYAGFDDFGLCPNSPGKNFIYLHLEAVDNKSPLAKSAIDFLTGNIPAQAFENYEIEINSLDEFIAGSIVMLENLGTAFKNVDQQMRLKQKSKSIFLAQSFVRLNNPGKLKLGGGSRVKQVLIKDNWNRMTGQFASVYGQDFEYVTEEVVNGEKRVISSGVASYEPGIGSEENPYREILQFSNKLPLASAVYGAIETPMLEALYPSPVVGYSKVTVRSIHRKGKHADSSLRSAIGKQVTEFYTAKDYPSFSTHTAMDSREYNKDPLFSLFRKEIKNHRTISQGFLVETNDMHGKIKAQLSYSENDERTPLTASYHSYKNTGRRGINDKVNFVYHNEGGAVREGNIGIDMELMTDVREFSVKSKGLSGQAQVDLFIFSLATYPVFTFFPLHSYGENRYRAVTCTKLINYHAVEDSVIIIDKGSVVSTKTVAYDAETGSPVVTETLNEFNDPVYNTTYPAYWAYSSAGLAYKNIHAAYQNVNFYDGKIISGVTDMTLFESGDELFITETGSGSTGCIAASGNTTRIWAFDKKKNASGLTIVSPDFVFIDSIGRPFTSNGVGFKIVRSGKRNTLGLSVSTATTMSNPVQGNLLVINNAARVVAASAISYREKWQVDNDVIKRRMYYTQACSNEELDSIHCTAMLEKKINPYIKGLVGNFKPHRSYAFYGSRNDTSVNQPTSIRKNGYLKNFENFWNFNTFTNLVPKTDDPKWVWNSEITRVDARGQELETKDPLNRYTAAQYGFKNSLPVAVMQNARYGEAFCDGFEDYDYEDNINARLDKECLKRYIDFGAFSNSYIVATSPLGFNAHSGKYALQVPPGISSRLDSTAAIQDSFSFYFPSDTSRTLYQPGGNLSFVNALPSASNYTATPHFGTGTGTNFNDYLMGLSVENNLTAGNSFNYSYSYKTTQYIQVLQDGTYEFYTRQMNNASSTFNTPTMDIVLSDIISSLPVAITVTGTVISPGTIVSTRIVCLKAGIYRIECTCGNQACITAPCTTGPIDTYQLWFNDNLNLVSYRTLQTIPDCDFTRPMPATEAMLNPVFKFSPGKRMLFSAWLRETCSNAGNNPCYDSTYSGSSVVITGDNMHVATITPAGAIIEGWQRMEGGFIVPAGTQVVKLELINNKDQPMYLDDIRVHPYNSNMKSYVYDPETLRLSAELDDNNHASFYEYDEEGQLVRVKKETVQGIKTIKESRTAKQKAIKDFD